MVALAMTMAGCSMDSTGPSGSVEGTYSLTRINGSTLPYRFSNGVTVVSEDLTLYRDGTYQDVTRYSSGQQGSDQGYYSNSNGALSFQSSANDLAYQGSVSGNVLTDFVAGFTQTYQKR
jgi:hypothetical protein